MVYMSSDFSMLWMVTRQRLHYWIIMLLCKVWKLSFQCSLPTLTDPTTGANLTSHMAIEQAKLEYYLTVLKFSLLLLSVFLELLGIFCFVLFFTVKKIWKSLWTQLPKFFIISQSSNICSEKYPHHNNQLIFSSHES